MAGGRRFAEIDALRGIAALLVVWMHTAGGFGQLPDAQGLWIRTLSESIDVGRVGVALFFIISGYVIPSSIRDNPDRTLELARFGLKRFFRLYPLFWVSLLFSLYTMFWAWGRPATPEFILGNATMIPQLLGVELAVGLYWTLATELMFYVACAVLYFFGLLRRQWVLVALSALSLASFVVYFLQTYFGLLGPRYVGLTEALWLGHPSLMFLGFLMRMWRDGEMPSRWVRLSVGLLFALWSLGFGSAALIAVIGGFPLAAATVQFAGAYSTGMLLFLAGAFVTPNTWRPVVWLGEISYSIYLLHPAILIPAIWALMIHGAPQIPIYWFMLAATLATIALSTLTYRFIEAPTHAFGIRLANRLRRSPAPAAAVGD